MPKMCAGRGAVKVAIAPLIGLPLAPVTVACSNAKAVLTATLCGVPAVAVILVGGPALLVNEKFAKGLFVLRAEVHWDSAT